MTRSGKNTQNPLDTKGNNMAKKDSELCHCCFCKYRRNRDLDPHQLRFIVKVAMFATVFFSLELWLLSIQQ